MIEGLTQERMAPGHVYNPATGTGIEWQSGIARLWEHGKVTESAPHDTANAWEFWYELAFTSAFPQITHWWFGSAWTGPVWLWTEGASADNLTLSGWMQFVDQHESALAWQITSSEPVQVATPMPPFQVNSINLPLRIVLAHKALGLFNGDVRESLSSDRLADLEESLVTDGASAEQVKLALNVASPPHYVTSLVARDELEQVFPTTMGAWRLEQVYVPLREALCTMMGLQPPTISECWTVVDADDESVGAAGGAGAKDPTSD